MTMKSPRVNKPKFPIKSRPTSKQVKTRGIPDMREPSMNVSNMKEINNSFTMDHLPTQENKYNTGPPSMNEMVDMKEPNMLSLHPKEKTFDEYSHPYFIEKTEQETVLDRTSKHGTIFDSIQMRDDPVKKMEELGYMPEYAEPGSLMAPKKGHSHRVKSQMLNFGALDKAADAVAKDVSQGTKQVSITKAELKRTGQGIKDVTTSGPVYNIPKHIRTPKEIELEVKQQQGVITEQELMDLRRRQTDRVVSEAKEKEARQIKKEGIQELIGPTGIKSLEPSKEDLEHMKSRGLKPEDLYVSDKSPRFKEKYEPIEVRVEQKASKKMQTQQVKEYDKAMREANRERRHQELLSVKIKNIEAKDIKKEEAKETKNIVSDISSFQSQSQKSIAREFEEQKQLNKSKQKAVKEEYIKHKMFNLTKDPKYLLLDNRKLREEYIREQFGTHDTQDPIVGVINLNNSDLTRMAVITSENRYNKIQKQPTKSELESKGLVSKATSTKFNTKDLETYRTYREDLKHTNPTLSKEQIDKLTIDHFTPKSKEPTPKVKSSKKFKIPKVEETSSKDEQRV